MARDATTGWRCRRQRQDQAIVEPLVIPFVVVVRDELADGAPPRALAAQAHALEAGCLEGFFEHADYEAVRRHLPPAYQDVLDFAYYSGWRKREILELRWSEVDEGGGVVRLSPERSNTRVGRVLPIVPPIAAVLARRRAQRQGEDPVVFRRDAVTVRAWRTA